ncbi:MAG: hypothetical protein HOG49_29295 [Candidatus Scalindua sp.]|jgi:hypothetical protein|nr:hypothetical protein [Candidatus Scalindua sp.]
MLSDKFIEFETKSLKALGDQLNKEALFAKQFIDSNKRPRNEINWFRSVRSISIFGTFQIKNLLDSLDNYKDKSEEQIGFYIGKIAIQSFLEIINAFEQSTNTLIVQNESFSERLNERIEKTTSLIEKSWKTDVNSESKKLRKDLIKGYNRKLTEMNFIRDRLRKHRIIDELDYKILKFSWDIRNSMHTDFVAIKDIEFSAPGTSLNYSFSFRKGEELYHPGDLLSFFSITEQIIFIHLKILQHFNKEKGKNES